MLCVFYAFVHVFQRNILLYDKRDVRSASRALYKARDATVLSVAEYYR